MEGIPPLLKMAEGWRKKENAWEGLVLSTPRPLQCPRVPKSSEELLRPLRGWRADECPPTNHNKAPEWPLIGGESIWRLGQEQPEGQPGVRGLLLLSSPGTITECCRLHVNITASVPEECSAIGPVPQSALKDGWWPPQPVEHIPSEGKAEYLFTPELSAGAQYRYA